MRLVGKSTLLDTVEDFKGVTLLPDIALSIKNNEEGNLILNYYPNPATESITLNVGGINNFNNTYITIFDYSGRTVLKEKVAQAQTQVNMAALSNGLYFIQLQSNNKVLRKKLAKE